MADYTMKIKNQIQRFNRYIKFLDETNAKILKALGQYGPRNITTLAKATNLPITTFRFRLKKLIEEGVLAIKVSPNLSKLGLAKAFFIAEAKLGGHNTLIEVVRNTDYWTYIIRCYGKMDGYCTYFAFPAEHRNELRNYLKRANLSRLFPRYQFFWITNSHYVCRDFSWYDFEEKLWRFQWHRWIKDISNASEDLPDILKETGDYQIMADKTDLLIIKEFEKDATIEFNKLAKILKITPQSVGARYHKHIIERKLILSYVVDVYPFPIQISDLYNFIIDFKDERTVAKFVNASNGKPFMVSYAKVIGRNSLIANIYILKTEFPNLIKSLNRLYSEGLIKKFFYVTLNPMSYKRQTIAYKNFENGKWTYNSEERIKRLKEIGRTH